MTNAGRALPLLILLTALVSIGPATSSRGQDKSASDAIDTQLTLLKHDDMEVRIEALRELMTSLDPRIPDAMLPRLTDEGNSIRRLAARAVGSRWWQISDERIEPFVAALKPNAASENYGEANMVRRALGLLQRDYDGEMFSRSPNKRWVIYERRGLPCLIDTRSSSEELLGWSADSSAWISASWGNDALDSSARWHPDKTSETVALSILLNRKASTVWFWQHGQVLEKLSPDDLVKALGMNAENIFHPGGFFTEIQSWKGKDCLIDLSFSTESGDDILAWDAQLAWNMETRSLRKISLKQSN